MPSAKQKSMLKSLGIDPITVQNRQAASRKIEDAILAKKIQQSQNKTPQKNIREKQGTEASVQSTLPTKVRLSNELASEPQKKRLLQLAVPIPTSLTKEAASLLIHLAQERNTAQMELTSMRNLIGKAVGDQWGHQKLGDSKCRER